MILQKPLWSFEAIGENEVSWPVTCVVDLQLELQSPRNTGNNLPFPSLSEHLSFQQVLPLGSNVSAPAMSQH